VTLPHPLVAGVIGWPVAHSRSPIIHRFWLEKMGLDGDYSRFPVAPERLADFVRAMPAIGLRGANVTIPHKVAVMDLLDDIDDTALSVGAVNTLKVFEDGRIGGVNTDIEGIMFPCRGLGIAGHEVIIIGSGGAARAAVGAAACLGAGWVTVIARNVSAATTMLQQMGQPGTVLPLGNGLPPSPDARLFFNATSLGMAGQPPLDLDLDALPAACTVFDAVYAPLETSLLRAAQARGLPIIDGLTMLVGQAASAFEIMFGALAPREHDAELRQRLLK